MSNDRLNRRRMIGAGLTIATAVSSPICRASQTRPSDGDTQVMTVTGPCHQDDLGSTLPHEHVLVDFVGADRVSSTRYDAEDAFRKILPFLRRAHDSGCRSMVECTPAYLGRDPRLLVRLSKAAGLRILTNTGYYGAGQGKFLPEHAYRETADELADRWLTEWHDGIEGTGVRPGFVKIGVNSGPLSDIDRKLVRAAARTHLKSGLTIAAHTGNGDAALEQIDLLSAEGVSSNAWIWVHAQSENDDRKHLEAARRGAWISLDGIGPDTVQRHVEMVDRLKGAGFTDRVLLSHDAGWYAVGEPEGGGFRGFETLYEVFLPALRNKGFTESEIRLLTVINPARAFARRVRAIRISDC